MLRSQEEGVSFYAEYPQPNSDSSNVRITNTGAETTYTAIRLPASRCRLKYWHYVPVTGSHPAISFYTKSGATGSYNRIPADSSMNVSVTPSGEVYTSWGEGVPFHNQDEGAPAAQALIYVKAVSGSSSTFDIFFGVELI